MKERMSLRRLADPEYSSYQESTYDSGLTGLTNRDLQKLFLKTIYEESQKEYNEPVQTYRVATDYLGVKSDGTRSKYAFGNERINDRFSKEIYIELEYAVIRANNPYTRWVKLYEYSKEMCKDKFKPFHKDTADQYLLPYFDNNDYDIYEETTPKELVDMVLKDYEQYRDKGIYFIGLNEV
jgi:hypothetical protein